MIAHCASIVNGGRAGIRTQVRTLLFVCIYVCSRFTFGNVLLAGLGCPGRPDVRSDNPLRRQSIQCSLSTDRYGVSSQLSV
jgi:hypothetical protein